MSEKREAIIVSKTHWDREHSRPFEQFRWHLVVNVMDKLLDILKTEPQFKSFTMDGQTLPMEDYLEIRPEKREEIEGLVKAGKLLIGPFYIGADEFIPSGESLIRNLFIGHKVGEQFGGVMKVAYNPDAFGHVSQMPQILRGFDISSFIFARGAGEGIGKQGTDFRWMAPDGSEILATHHHYGNAANMPLNSDEAFERMKGAIEAMLPKQLDEAGPLPLLFTNGTDGTPPQREIPAIIEGLNSKFDDVHFAHGTFADYMEKVQRCFDKLKTFKGELRWGTHNLILSGVYSSRTYIKKFNTRCQMLLEKFAEPLSAFAWLEGDDYPIAFLERAWKLLIRNHFHDTICCCSQDKVYDDAMNRYAHSEQISQKLIERSTKVLARQINTKCPVGAQGVIPLVVYNPLSWNRSDVVTQKIYAALDADTEDETQPQHYAVVDSSGSEICSQMRNVRIGELFQLPHLLWERRYPPGKRLQQFDISFMVDNFPPCGYKAFFLIPQEQAEQEGAHPEEIRTMENDLVCLEINHNGAMRLTDKMRNLTYDGLHLFEDVESIAGEYYHYTSPTPKVITTLGERPKISLVENGPVCWTFSIELEMMLPESASEDFEGRSEKLVKCPITTFVTLHDGSARVNFRTIVQNKAKDHRLRVLFPTGISAEHVNAESVFEVVERPVNLPEAEGWVDKPTTAAPQQTFVDASDGERGLTLINRGITEYAAEEGSAGVSLSLTLLRAVGSIGREGFPVAYNIPTPQAQCIGAHEFEYAIFPHGGDWKSARIWREAHNFSAPFHCVETDIHEGCMPDQMSFVSVDPPELVVSAVKKAADADAVIVRLFNITDDTVGGRLAFYKAIRKAELLDLLEQPIGVIESIDGNRVSLTVPPHKIITLRLET